MRLLIASKILVVAAYRRKLDEIAARMDIPLEKVRSLLAVAKEPVSLEAPAGPDGSRSFFDTNTSVHPHFYLVGEDVLTLCG